MKKLQINIVTLNNLEYLKNAIKSIKTKYEYELLIIDQESNDGTIDWLKENNIRYHRFEPRVCLSKAWNFGFINALKNKDIEYIFFPNNDVIFHSSTIDNLVFAYEELNRIYNNKYVMVTGSNIAPEMDLTTFNLCKVLGDFEFDKKEITNWREQGPDFSCPLISIHTLQQVGFFDENFIPAYYEDNDYHLRIVKLNKIAKRISYAPYYHFGSMTIKSNPYLGINSSKTERVFIEKWGHIPALCMDGLGYQKPYNDDKYNITDWKNIPNEYKKIWHN